MESIKTPTFTPDHFQQEILDKLHLEFFFEKCRFLITPQFGYLVTGEVQQEEESALQQILEEKQSELEKLKDYLIYNLSLYSALLETNSYYIALNGNLLVARFIPLADEQDRFEIKIYTISRHDLPDNYKDKIYLGRDFLSFRGMRRPHFDLKHIRDSLQEQFRKLRSRLSEHVPEPDLPELEHEYLQEIEEFLGDLAQSSNKIIESFPVDLTSRELDTDTLIRANMIFREIKHILIEMEETVRELERRMFEKALSRAVRYVTKFRKDVTNDVNYITFKVNGRISDHINGIHF